MVQPNVSEDEQGKMGANVEFTQRAGFRSVRLDRPGHLQNVDNKSNVARGWQINICFMYGISVLPYRKARCDWCKNIEHFARACMKNKGKPVNALETERENNQLQLFHVQNTKQPQLLVVSEFPNNQSSHHVHRYRSSRLLLTKEPALSCHDKMG